MTEPWKLAEMLREIEQAAALVDHVHAVLKPCLGSAWTTKINRLHKTIQKFAKKTATHYALSRKQILAAKYPQVACMPQIDVEYIKSPAAAATFHIKENPPPTRKLFDDDALGKLDALEDREPRIDAALPAKPAVKPPPTRARQKMAYIPGVDRYRE